MSEDYKYLGNFNAATPEAGVYLTCDQCSVSWIGCWDNNCCPQCGDHEAWEKLGARRKLFKILDETDSDIVKQQVISNDIGKKPDTKPPVKDAGKKPEPAKGTKK